MIAPGEEGEEGRGIGGVEGVVIFVLKVGVGVGIVVVTAARDGAEGRGSRGCGRKTREEGESE